MIDLVFDGVLCVCEVCPCTTVETSIRLAEDTVAAQSKSLAKASKDLAKVPRIAFMIGIASASRTPSSTQFSSLKNHAFQTVFFGQNLG
jgi:hypothetical protein